MSLLILNYYTEYCDRMRYIKNFVWVICVIIFIQLFLTFLIFRTVNNKWIFIKTFKDVARHVRIESNVFSSNVSIDVTVVTAFYDIGLFSKRVSHKRDKELYFTWMEKFRYIRNNVVFFTDSDESRRKMIEIRKQYLKKTKIIKVDSANKSKAWPFRNLKKFENIFHSPPYSNFSSIYPVYSCVCHAKYYVMKLAAEKDFFHTRYIMWLDIGYFRKRTSKRPFHISTPKGFNNLKIAATQVYPNKTFDIVPQNILKSKNVIVSGALFFGERSQIIKYVTQFRRAVEFFLKENLTNTDEQIVYAMYSKKANTTFKPDVELQLYPAKKQKDWFYIGYTMIQENSSAADQ